MGRSVGDDKWSSEGDDKRGGERVIRGTERG